MPNHGSEGEEAEVIDLAATRLEKEASDPKLINTSAEAVLLFSKLPALWALRKGWDELPSSVQRRLLGANRTEIGKFVMKWVPALHPESYFMHEYFLSFLAKLGMLELKLTNEEEEETEKALMGNPDPQAREKLRAQKQEAVLGSIVVPGAGWIRLGKETPLLVEAEVPELAMVLKTAGRLEKTRERYLASVRGAVRDKRAEKEVAETQRKEHNGEVQAAGLSGEEERKAA